MSRILILNIGGHGHVNPTLALTQELVARGHDVSYVVPEPHGDAVLATGASFFAYDSLWAKQTPPTRATLKDLMLTFRLRLLREAQHALPQIIDSVRLERPDVVLYDSMCLAGRFLAESLGIPAATLNASYVSNQHFNMGSEFPKAVLPPEVVQQTADVARELAEDFGIKTADAQQIFGKIEPLNIVFMPRVFQKAGDTFDERFVFCGPNLGERKSAGSWAPPTGPRQRRMFISLGTVFSNWPEFFDTCFEAFGDGDWDVLMATSTRLDASKLGVPPANFHVAPHFPQLDVLPHMDVFVTHGGMNSTQESLYFGVPMVVIPQMAEQAVTARRVVELGLGKALMQEKVTAEVLAEAVESVAEDAAIKANVAVMQKAVREAGGAMRAADAVEGYLAATFKGPERGATMQKESPTETL